MTLFFMLLPVYLFGNIHCLGMCGPLVMLIGQHPYRYCYFMGRLFSYSLAGWAAGEAGAVLHLYLSLYHLAAVASLTCGILICGWGLSTLFGWHAKQNKGQSKLMARLNLTLSQLLLKETAWSTFLFGCATVLLPCGQTLVVFSACALAGGALVGLLNGLVLALFTTPSLLLAMQAHYWFKRFRGYTDTVLGLSTVAVGLMACCRGLADLGWIAHWIINPHASPYYHIVIY